MKMKSNIALIGKMHEGKSSVATILEEDYGYARWAFAGPVKELGDKALTQIIDPELRNMTGKTFNPTKAKNRPMYQLVGARGRAYNLDIWVQKLAQQFLRLGGPSGIVIDDMRYLNEAAWAHISGFTLVRVVRPEEIRLASIRSAFQTDYGRPPHDWEEVAMLNHESETEVDSIVWDLRIDNDADIQHLRDQVATILAGL